MNRFAENKHVIIEETSPNRPNTTNKVQRSTSQTHFTPKYEESPAGGNNEIINQIGSGPKRSSSGLLSIFKWFKKNPDRDNIYTSSSSSSSSTTASNSSLNNDESTNTPNPLSRNQSAASVDSLFSTATVASFTYIPPAVYNPFGNAEIPEKLIAPGPETNTHKNRMKQLEKVRERDKNITLRKKYKLFSGDNTTNKNKTNSNSKKNKKNKKDTIVNTNRDYCELSLPLIKCQNKNSMDKSVDDNNKSDNNRSVIKSHHRRTVSESSKDKKAGAYCHVKGKRRAPPPPSQNNTETIRNDENTNTLTRKMKRQAPQPPASTSENNQITSNLTKEQKDFLITNIAKLQSTQSNSVEIMTSQNGINELINNVPDVVCNDSLKLESGILKPVKETLKTTDNKNEKKSVTASPISPKPWYKRTLSSSSSNRDSLNHSSSHFRKEFAKHQSKSEGNDDNVFKYPKENSKLSNVLSRFSMSSDERKKDENRKSAISMLANISELDREAALIVQKEQNKMQAQIDAQNEAFYSPSSSQNDVPGFLMSQQQEQQQKNTCKKGSARELISKFNALTSATRISVNSALFSSNKEDNRNSRRFSFQPTENDIKNKYSPFSVVTPPMKRSIFKLEEFSEKDEEVLPTPMWKSNDTNFEPKIVNTPPNIMKYFEPQKTESKVDDKTLDEQPKNNLATEVKKDGWTCTRCTLENGRMDLKCVACGMWKPFGKVVDKYFGPQKDNKSNDKDVKPTNEKTQNLENETKMARTFAENVFKAFEMDDEADKKLDEVKSENDTVKETAIVSSVTVVEPELSLEELRKARLARFSQNLDDLENIPKSPPPEKEEKQNDLNEVKTNKSESCDPQLSLSASNKLLSEEQKKLRKMLKEMRDSLPKTGSTLTPKSTLEKIPIKEDVELKIVEENDLKNDEIKNKETDTGIKDVSKGAIPKVFNKTSPKPVIVDEILKNKDEKVITAYVITKETTYENIKVRKENVDLDKPIKVSASSQTQSVKVTTKPPLGRENIMLPLSVEEMSTPAKTTISRVGSFGKGQFELIRAKDFAGISSNVTTPDSPLYANLPATLETLEKTSITASPSNSSSQQSINNSSSEEEILSVQLSDPEGIKDFKATLRQDKHNANTLAINRLLRRLETAIASGQHVQAAKLAKDLARLKVNCSVTRQKKIETPNTKYITADMYVEDQVTHQGPIPLRVNPDMTIADLKQKVAQEFEIPSHVQRWILDRQLASDDEMTLGELNINFDGCPMFLYLVAPDGEFDVETLKRASKRVRDGIKAQAVEEDLEQSDSDANEDEEAESAVNEATNDANDTQNIIPPNLWRCPVCTLLNTLDRPGCEACSTERPRSVEPKQKNYLQLMDLDNTDLVSNIEPFECLICFTECQIGEGVILRECLHSFCKECLAHTIEYTEEVEIKCPYRDSDYSCDLVLQEREIKALVSKEIYEQHLALSVKQAETKIDNAFHCKTPDCRGWCIFEDNVNEFKCPVCKANNCLTCQVIHEGLNCKQYQEQLNQNSESNVEARRTKDFLDEMVSRGEAMVCPTCQVVLMKKWGCDWLRCSMCKTEICWVTRGPRWGPTGKGDVTGGCKCGVNGIKCHPKCTYCH